MNATQTVYLETNALGEEVGVTTEPPKSGRVLIREGQPIAGARLEKYDGALELAEGGKKAAPKTAEKAEPRKRK